MTYYGGIHCLFDLCVTIRISNLNNVTFSILSFPSSHKAHLFVGLSFAQFDQILSAQHPSCLDPDGVLTVVCLGQRVSYSQDALEFLRYYHLGLFILFIFDLICFFGHMYYFIL